MTGPYNLHLGAQCPVRMIAEIDMRAGTLQQGSGNEKAKAQPVARFSALPALPAAGYIRFPYPVKDMGAKPAPSSRTLIAMCFSVQR